VTAHNDLFACWGTAQGEPAYRVLRRELGASSAPKDAELDGGVDGKWVWMTLVAAAPSPGVPA
jgi:hypothetical protein